MGIKDGDLTSADEVLNAMALNFKTQSNLIWNADLNGFNSSLEEEFDNTTYDTLQDNSMIDEANSDIDDSPIFPAAVMDNHDDSSVDTNIWTTASSNGSVSEDTTHMSVVCAGGAGASASATADQVNSVDLNSDGIVLFVKVRNMDATYADGAASAKLSILDDSANSVTIKEINQVDANLGETIFRVNIDTGNNTMGIHTDITQTADTGTDISSLQDGDTWHLVVSVSLTSSGGSGSCDLGVYFERFIDNAVETDDFISDAVTSSSTITNATLVVSDDTDVGTITYYLSADNGANYEEVTPNEIHRFSNTGTQLKLKATMVSTTSDMPILNHYAVRYNWY